MEKKSIEITKAELGAVISEHDRDQTRLFEKRRKAKKADRPNVEAQLKTLYTRLIRELEVIFEAWPWPENDDRGDVLVRLNIEQLAIEYTNVSFGKPEEHGRTTRWRRETN